jgi:hypothetical protein
MSAESKPKPTITAKAILAALAEIKRRGHWPLFQQLEHREPDLAEHVLEELSLIHQTLIASGASAKITRRLQRQVQCLVLVTVMAVRQGALIGDPPSKQGDQT